MSESHVFEYAVIRIVPQVEREEFVNAGVVLFCKSLSFLDMKWSLDENLLRSFSPALDMEEVKTNLIAFCTIAAGTSDSGPIGQLPLPERFRWLTATRSTILQPSHVHPGYTQDPKATLDRLFKQLVKR